MTEPTRGGRYIRNPETGEIAPAVPVDTAPVETPAATTAVKKTAKKEGN